MKLRGLVIGVAIVAVLSANLFAIQIMEPGFQIETIANYNAGGTRGISDIAFDGDGNLYILHASTSEYTANGRIMKIDYQGNVSVVKDNIQRPARITYGGGGAYGDYMYMTTMYTIEKIDSAGNVSFFANCNYPYNGVGPVTLYEDQMYFFTRSYDAGYKVDVNGNISSFSPFPGHHNGGGPSDLAISKGSDFPDGMYIGSTFTYSFLLDLSGVFSLDENGNATKITDEIATAGFMEFDNTGNFGKDLFIMGRETLNADAEIYRIDENGNASLFGDINRSINYCSGIDFDDGNMYFAEHTISNDEVNVYKISPSLVEMVIDIKPGSCKNPVNVKSKGVLSVVILGSEELDVNSIDIASIRLAGARAIRSSFEDIATPSHDDCKSFLQPDGYTDLVLKFETREIVESLGEVLDGEEWILTLDGMLYDGTGIEGEDYITILAKGKANVEGAGNENGKGKAKGKNK